MNILDRRLDLLRLEGLGFNSSEITKELSEKYQVTRRAIQLDFQNRKKWQPTVLDLADSEKLFMKLLNRFEQAYREVSFMAIKTQNENIHLGALRLKAEITEMMVKSLIPDKTLLPTQITEIKLSWDQTGDQKEKSLRKEAESLAWTELGMNESARKWSDYEKLREVKLIELKQKYPDGINIH
jgi:hypothetical protein